MSSIKSLNAVPCLKILVGNNQIFDSSLNDKFRSPVATLLTKTIKHCLDITSANHPRITITVTLWQAPSLLNTRQSVYCLPQALRL